MLELSAAIFVLLMTPGPTNTLMLISGSERGLPRSLRLIPFEIAGYMCTVLPLALVGNALLAPLPGLRAAVAVMAGIWVAYLAATLWRLPAPGLRRASVTGRAVFTTTVLNPKALIFGLVLLPHPDHLALNIGIFVGEILLVATGWAMLGAAIGHGATAQQGRDWMPLLRRTASVWLAFISITLILRGIGVA